MEKFIQGKSQRVLFESSKKMTFSRKVNKSTYEPCGPSGRSSGADLGGVGGGVRGFDRTA